MDKKEIFKFLNNNQVFYLATVEGDIPHVRAMVLYHADENGIIFHTGKTKDVYKQLQANPRAELCFNNFEVNAQVRIAGKVELVDDINLKKEIAEQRPFLKAWIMDNGYDMLSVYCLKSAIATVWTIEDNLAPKIFIAL
jgi:pyridoxamine 5'-phosphate oxidase